MNAEAALRSTVGRWQGPRLAIYEVTEDAGQPSCTVSTTQAQGHTWVAPSAVRLAGGGRVLWSGSFVLDPGESSDTTITWSSLMTERKVTWQRLDGGGAAPDGGAAAAVSSSGTGSGGKGGKSQRAPRGPPGRHSREIRDVWASNFQQEFSEMVDAVARSGESTILSLCVDFPALCCSDARSEEASRQYKELRATVDDHWPLQAGMVVSTSDGLIQGVWNYNFFFDEEVHKHNESSLSTLRVSGVDVARHKLEGIDAVAFGQNLGNSVLVGQYGCTPWWLTFSGSYHFGFLLKVLTKGRPLPEEVGSFLGALSVFCPLRYDLREQLPWDSLDALAGRHGVQRHGPHWQAGSNALLSLELYMRITPGLEGTLRPDPLPDPAQLLAWAPTPPGQWHPPPPEAPPAPEPEGLGRGGRAKGGRVKAENGKAGGKDRARQGQAAEPVGAGEVGGRGARRRGDREGEDGGQGECAAPSSSSREPRTWVPRADAEAWVPRAAAEAWVPRPAGAGATRAEAPTPGAHASAEPPGGSGTAPGAPAPPRPWRPAEEGDAVCGCAGDGGAREALGLLLGAWRDDSGCLHEVTDCVPGQSLTVLSTKGDGTVITSKGRVSMKPDGSGEMRVLWGVTHVLSEVVTPQQGFPLRARWSAKSARGKNFAWEKQEAQPGAGGAPRA